MTIKSSHREEIESDAKRIGVEPDVVISMILNDFFAGWSREDRPKFYRQVMNMVDEPADHSFIISCRARWRDWDLGWFAALAAGLLLGFGVGVTAAIFL